MSDPNKPDNTGAVVAAVLGGLALVGGAVAIAAGGKKQPALKGASASGGLGRRSTPGRFAKGCGCGGR